MDILTFAAPYLFIYFVCSILGWILEVFYRKYFGKARRWINPGFLAGPVLPIYGFAAVFLYAVSSIEMNFYVRILVFVVSTTGIEYLTGLFFLKFFKVRLWDYRKLKFNIQGLVCPMYTVFWGIMATLFYLYAYPWLSSTFEFLRDHTELMFYIGIAVGIHFVDFLNSYHIGRIIRKQVKELKKSKFAIGFEEVKDTITDSKLAFIISLPFRGVKHIGEAIADLIKD